MATLLTTYAPGYRGNANVGGTGEATWHPAGIYCGSTMWQYGAQYKNATGIYEVSTMQMYSGPFLEVYNTRNLIVKSRDGGGDAGILGRGSADQFAFQLYGDGENSYGFLGYTWGDWDLRKVSDGNLYMNNNNAYYLNTGGSSYLYQLSVNYNLYLDNNYGSSIIGVYSSTRYQGVWAMGEAYKLSLDGTSTGSLYGLAWSHPNAGGVAGNLNTHGLLVMENGTFLAAISGSIRARDDMRAPIFYDSADTGYYLDLNASSYLYKLTLSGNSHFFPNSWVEFGGYYGLYSGNNNAHFYPNNGSYGSWKSVGTRGGWAGIEFEASNGNVSLMVNPNSNTVGFHNNSYGWQFYWEGGTLYCNKNSYGAGTSATVLDSSNWSSYVTQLVTGNTTAASINTSKLNIYNDNFTEEPVILQMNARDILVNDRMQQLTRLRGGIGAGVELMIDSAGFYFWTVDQIWMPIFTEYVEQLSDINYKHYIRTIPSALDKVKQLRGVEFLWKKNNQPSLGFIAQEVEEVLPVAVGDVKGVKTLDYSKIVPVLTEAIKEQQILIEQLMARIEALESK